MAMNIYGGVRVKDFFSTFDLPLSFYAGGETLRFPVPDGMKIAVAPGKSVVAGNVLARAEDGFCLRSSAAGKILSVENGEISLQNDFSGKTLQLFQPLDQPVSHYKPEDLIHLFCGTGLVGVYSGVPVYKKLQNARGKTQRLILNCMETDPSTGHVSALLRAKAHEIILGAKLLMHTLGVRKTILAIDGDDTDTLDALRPFLTDKNMFVVAPFRTRYPMGNDKLLVSAIYGSEIPVDKTTEDAGYAVFSVETVLQVFESLITGKAPQRKIFTCTGSALRKPANLSVLIGTSVAEVLQACGGLNTEEFYVLSGGVLNGQRISVSDPVLPTTNVLVANQRTRQKHYHCSRCSRCTDVCPMHLTPYKLYENACNGKHSENVAMGLYNCIECGSCAYVCIGRVDLLSAFRADKLQDAYSERVFDDEQEKLTEGASVKTRVDLLPSKEKKQPSPDSEEEQNSEPPAVEKAAHKPSAGKKNDAETVTKAKDSPEKIPKQKPDAEAKHPAPHLTGAFQKQEPTPDVQHWQKDSDTEASEEQDNPSETDADLTLIHQMIDNLTEKYPETELPSASHPVDDTSAGDATEKNDRDEPKKPEDDGFNYGDDHDSVNIVF